MVTSKKVVAFSIIGDDSQKQYGPWIIVHKVVPVFCETCSEGLKFLIFRAEIVFTKTQIHLVRYGSRNIACGSSPKK